MSYELPRDDISPVMQLTVLLDGAPVDCSDADSVELRWVKPDGTVAVDDLTPVAAALGQFTMDWATGDTDQVGAHFGQVLVTIDGVQETYPASGPPIIWWVYPKVGDDC